MKTKRSNEQAKNCLKLKGFDFGESRLEIAISTKGAIIIKCKLEILFSVLIAIS
jgi:hypothetical protein